MTVTINGTGTGAFTDASGNAGIGTATPAASLSITKQTTALSGSGNSYGFYAYPTSSGAVYVDAITNSTGTTSLNFRTYNNTAYNTTVMDSSGNIQVGGTTVGNTAGYVNSRTNARAWVTFTGSTGAVVAGYNVSSITRNGAGDYTFNFTTALADTNYAYFGQGYGGGAQYQIAGGSQGSGTVKTTSSLRLQYGYVSSVGGILTNQDPITGYLMIFGN